MISERRRRTMTMSNDELSEYLSILDIKVGDDLEAVTLRDATVAFQNHAQFWKSVWSP